MEKQDKVLRTIHDYMEKNEPFFPHGCCIITSSIAKKVLSKIEPSAEFKVTFITDKTDPDQAHTLLRKKRKDGSNQFIDLTYGQIDPQSPPVVIFESVPNHIEIKDEEPILLPEEIEHIESHTKNILEIIQKEAA